MRGGPAFRSTEALFWRIYGDKGEIQVTGSDTFLQASDDNFVIEVFDHKSGETEKVEVDKDEFSELPLFSRNVARLYEAFADGKEDVLDWAVAVKRHAFVADVYDKAGVV